MSTVSCIVYRIYVTNFTFLLENQQWEWCSSVRRPCAGRMMRRGRILWNILGYFTLRRFLSEASWSHSSKTGLTSAAFSARFTSSHRRFPVQGTPLSTRVEVLSYSWIFRDHPLTTFRKNLRDRNYSDELAVGRNLTSRSIARECIVARYRSLRCRKLAYSVGVARGRQPEVNLTAKNARMLVSQCIVGRYFLYAIWRIAQILSIWDNVDVYTRI